MVDDVMAEYWLVNDEAGVAHLLAGSDGDWEFHPRNPFASESDQRAAEAHADAFRALPNRVRETALVLARTWDDTLEALVASAQALDAE